MTQRLELVYKNFETDILNMFKDVKENIVSMNEQIGNLSREIEAIKTNKWQFQKKPTKFKMKNLIGGSD